MSKLLKGNFVFCNLLIVFIIGGLIGYSALTVEKPEYLIITVAGDCTIGSYPEVMPGKSFIDVLEKNNNSFEYPFKNTTKWFHQDDLTIVNFEGTLTEAQVPAQKKWRFKGPQEYVNILNKADIEAVNLANNHSYDYLKEGYKDTIATLDSAGVGVFGNGEVFTKEIRGIKVTLLGYQAFSQSEVIFKKVQQDLEKARKNGAKVIICSFHWGVEYQNTPTKFQQRLGRHAIDAGADLVIGHHPHILQGIEEYKGRYIAYSLGNFVFGGNELLTDQKHRDIDTILLQQEIELVDKAVARIKLTVVPFQISGDKEFNNYQPVQMAGAEAIRIRDKLLKISEPLQYGIKELEIGG